MGRIPIYFDEDVEIELRNRAKKKGDLSIIINDACKRYFKHADIILDKDVLEELTKRKKWGLDLSLTVNDALRTVFLMKAPKRKG